MLRWLELENKAKDPGLDERRPVQDKIKKIVNSKKKREYLKKIAQSRSAGIWRIKRAKIILITLSGKTVKQMVLDVRVSPESIIKCQDSFAKNGFSYFNKPERGPTIREAKVEKMLAFLETPEPKYSPQWKIVQVRYIGKDLTARDIQQIRKLISNNPDYTIGEIIRQVCLLFNFYQSNGKLQLSQTNHILKRMDMDNLITLPPPHRLKKSGKYKHSSKKSCIKALSTPRRKRKLSTFEIQNLQFIPVHSKNDSFLWRELIEKYHYIKTTRLFGAQLRYLVYGDQNLPTTLNYFKANSINPAVNPSDYYQNVERGKHLLAALGFASSAWRLASRDWFVGWTNEQRETNLKFVVNNARFLILPWIQSKYLASRILGGIVKQLPLDWEARYHYRPVLLETFVQSDRFKGTCYKAANWIQIGQTDGYSLVSGYKKNVSKKMIFVFPLCKNFREILKQMHGKGKISGKTRIPA